MESCQLGCAVCQGPSRSLKTLEGSDQPKKLLGPISMSDIDVLGIACSSEGSIGRACLMIFAPWDRFQGFASLIDSMTGIMGLHFRSCWMMFLA